MVFASAGVPSWNHMLVESGCMVPVLISMGCLSLYYPPIFLRTVVVSFSNNPIITKPLTCQSQCINCEQSVNVISTRSARRCLTQWHERCVLAAFNFLPTRHYLYFVFSDICEWTGNRVATQDQMFPDTLSFLTMKAEVTRVHTQVFTNPHVSCSLWKMMQEYSLFEKMLLPWNNWFDIKGKSMHTLRPKSGQNSTN